ncbi:diguanylate cyclase domain-containing protein [Candidatus Igneacidithiobacillus taiwanensis]|uniref:diguanylate cyclase domain-containing protein n=1 Tax=Candidatus Igneacidithiobacillus taiwanensis TaxID=1945924 RepID=UPI002898BF41|nr:diguanylate cyclase [Candidatus Igneacidithiobacillus taiwanensis]MCE5360402.1 diguanylate cyclase [Acidithiobacillus sp.]
MSGIQTSVAQQAFTAAVAQAAASAFAELMQENEIAAFLDSLDADTLQHLQNAQREHFAWLLQEEDAETRDARSRAIGMIHQRLELPADWLVFASGLFATHLRGALQELLPKSGEEEITRRLAIDLVQQLRGMRVANDEEEAIIDHIDLLLLSEADEQKLLQSMLDKIVLLPGIDGAWIGKPQPNGTLEAITIAGADMASYLEHVDIRVDQGATAQGPMGRAWRSGKAVAVADLQSDPLFAPWREIAQSHGSWRSTMALPIYVGGTQQALCGIYSRIPRYFSAGQRRRTFLHLARMLGVALERQEQQARLKRSHRLYQIFLREGDILMRSRSPQTILRRTCHRLVEHDFFTTAFVLQPNASGYFVPLTAAGKTSHLVGQLRLSLEDCGPPTLFHRAWREGRLHYRNTEEETSYPGTTLNFAAFGWNSLAAVPILHEAAVWALLVVTSDLYNYFDNTLLATLARTAKLLGFGLDELALKNRIEAEREEQSWRAEHDPLTSLSNRSGYLRMLPTLLQRNREADRLLAVGMMDLDNFKIINDTHGHAAGDEVLQWIAERLLAALRQDDLVARFGGDEFALALTDLRSMEDLEAILRRVEETLRAPIPLSNGHSVQVGASLGITLYPFDEASEEILLRHADQALYASKAQKLHRSRFYLLYDGLDQDLLADPASSPR